MRGWTLAALVALGTASAGCSLEQRVSQLEARSGKEGTSRKDDDLAKRVKNMEDSAVLGSALLVRWHKLAFDRLAAIERREERMRLEVARLEKWEASLVAREGALGKGGAVTPAPTPAPVGPVLPPVVATPGTPTDKMYVQPGANPWADPFALATAQALSQLFATGERPKGSDFLDGKDETGVPVKPRDPGKTGVDGGYFVGKTLEHSRFVSSSGDPIDLARWKGKKNIVLVVLRGFDGSICVACSGQTLAISQNLDEFAKRDAEVFLLYPGKADSVPVFLDAVRDLGGGGSLPVEILLDVDLSVVHDFQIEGKLAKPTTLIIDKQGIVRFAHVGRTKTDRPTVPQMLEVLDRLDAKEQK